MIVRRGDWLRELVIVSRSALEGRKSWHGLVKLSFLLCERKIDKGSISGRLAGRGIRGCRLPVVGRVFLDGVSAGMMTWY